MKTSFARILVLSSCIFSIATNAAAQSTAPGYALRSPDKRIEVRVHTGDRLKYDVLLNGQALLQDSTLAMDVEHKTFGRNPKLTGTKESTKDQVLDPVVRQKFAKIRENCNELRLQFDGGYAAVFRAYNEGVAYRFETSLPQGQVKIYSEEDEFHFLNNYNVFYPREESFMSHNERRYVPQPLAGITAKDIATLPAIVDAGGVKVAIAESDVEDYPGLWLRGFSGNGLAAAFPPYPLKERFERDLDLFVTEAADYIATTRGTRSFPWRVIGIAEKDTDLLTNQIIWLLEKPSQLQDTSWIKPGKVSWDWWNANNVYGVDFKAGINTATYKYYVDFASKYGVPYVILDAGWSKTHSVLEVIPEINMDDLTAYAKQKNVGIILWVSWKLLDDQLEPALDLYAKWGIKGIKVDFMQRSDQPLINYYHKVCREAAKRKLLVDFHGDQKPATMTRTWPNLINTEGVRGLEWSKWSAETEPEHNVTIPFTRMFLGPMDYTPGAMLNSPKASFAPIYDHPMSLGTRCHQLAMYVVYEAPLQMLSDSPSNYLREPEIMEFLGPVPTEWDETKPLDGRISEYVAVARRNGRDWYVGAMTNWTSRDLEIDLSFLPEGTFALEAYQDGVNAERFGSDYRKTRSQVSRSSKIKIHLAAGGGWAAHLHP